MTKHFTIIRSLVPPKTKWIEDIKTGQLCYMGQILLQLKAPTYLTKGKEKIPCRFVHELNHPIPPLTRMCLGYLVQTDLATDILLLAPENEGRLAFILKKADWTVEFK